MQERQIRVIPGRNSPEFRQHEDLSTLLLTKVLIVR